MPETDKKLLPCIQAVGPWWPERDRLLLFCHLKTIFNLEAEYIASLPQAKGVDENGPFHIDENVILSEHEKFKKNAGGKKISCPRLKEQSFSFGKMNTRLCYLCPYSREFKNDKIEEEYRLVYYFLGRKILLKEYFNDSAVIRDVFRSYFPAYVNGILVDTYPFSFIIENALEMNLFNDNCSNDILVSDISLLESVHKKIEKRIPYIRIKQLLMDYEPNLSSIITASADVALKKLIDENADTRVPGNLIIQRLFSLLKDRATYAAKPAYEYKIRNEGLMKSAIFQKGIPDASVKTEDSTLELHLDRMVETGVKDIDAECVAVAECFSRAIENSGHDVLHDLPSGADISIITHAVENEDVANEEHTKENGAEKEVLLKNIIFSSFYEITDVSSVFLYGSAGDSSDEAIFETFLEDSSYLCMEPALCKGLKGLLISNGTEKIFFCISDYGPRSIRKIADMRIPVYTSNIYMLCRYLFRNKVFRLNLKDVGIALSLKTGNEIKGLWDIVPAPFPECIDEYASIYRDCENSISDIQKSSLRLLEKYTGLLCSDGNDFPFEKKDSIYRQDSSTAFSYLYEEGNLPLIPGKYLSIRALNPDNKTENVLEQQYMNTCIELNEHIPFVHGNIYILKSDLSGLLLYVTGSGSQIKKIQLYLSSSARRVFSSRKSESPVVLEEKEQQYLLHKKTVDF